MSKEGNVKLDLFKLKKVYNLAKGGQKKVVALNEVSLTFIPGLYGLLGPNGSGKSTMMNIITGNVKPSSGLIVWNKENALKNGAKLRKALGYMPQQQGIYDSFTGNEFLNYFCLLKEIPKEEILDETARVAALVHLEDAIGRRISTYSGGMKQRLLAAQALLGDPRVLLFDEPTAGLDPKERVSLRKVLSQSTQQNRIVIVATHIVSDIESVADKIVILKDGSIADTGSVNELIKKYAPNNGLEDVYLNIFGEEAESD